MNQFSGVVLAAVANSFWQVLVALAAASLVLRYAPRINAATRHLIWWNVLGLIVLMPAMSSLTHSGPRRPATHEVRYSSPARPSMVNVSQRPTHDPAPPAALEPAPHRAVARSSALAIRAGQWPARIFALWFAVLLVQLGRIAWSYRYLRGIKRRSHFATTELRRDFDVWMMASGVHRPAQLLISREILSPMAVGFRTPAVIIPEALLAEFSETELDHVLLHELAHLARRDDWSNLAARLCWAILVLHPAAAWVLRRIEREREIACDDWVVAATGEARPYAACLARLFELCFTRRRALLATGMAERASLLGDRIEMLLRRRREFTRAVSVARVAACAAILMLFLAVGSLTPRWIALARDEAPAPAAFESQAAPAIPAPAAPAPAAKSSFLAALVAAGYGDLPVDDIIALKNNGISASFLVNLNRSGVGKLPVRDLIQLKNNGISPELLRDMREAGLGSLTIADVVDLHNNGVDAAYVRAIQTSGLATFSRQQIVDFRRSGVRPELLRSLKDAGFRNVEPREIIDLQNNGVGERNLQEARQYGSNLTLKQIIKLKQAGVI